MRIAQAAAMSGLSPRQIRYYQELGVLTRGGRMRGQHREFSDHDVRRLTALRILLSAGLTPPLAARAVEGRLTPREGAELDQRLERQGTLTHRVRTQLGHAPVPASDDQPDISLMFDIFVLRTRMGAALTAALAEVGVTASEYALLSLLRESGSGTAGELAAQLGIAPAALGRQLADLVRRDWLLRRAGLGRQRITFALTRTGEERFAAALPLAARVAADLDRGLRRRSTDPDDARTLLQTLSATLGALAAERSP